MASRTPPILIHATPPLDPLPASDIKSIYLAGLLQLANPGRWGLTTSDWGDNGGNIPYITHLNHQIREDHLKSLPGFEHPDASLSDEDRAESLAWEAYIEGQLTDLVNHTLYSLPPNYPATVGKSRLTGLAFPQNLYIPIRLKSLYRSRLDHVGLWGLGGLNEGDAIAEDRKRLDENMIVGPGGTVAPRVWSGWRAGREVEERRQKWGEEEIIKWARGVLDPLKRRLGNGPYFFGDKSTSLDVYLFAHTTFLLSPHLPNPLLQKLLNSAYPQITLHHTRVFQSLFRGSFSTIPLITPRAKPQASLYETLTSWITGTGELDEKEQKKRDEMTGMEKKLEKGRWAWYLGAAGAMIGYLLLSGMVQFERISDDDDEEDEEDIDGEEESLEDIAEESAPEVEIIAVEIVEPEVTVGDVAA